MEDSIRLVRLLKDTVRMSVLNTGIDTHYIGKHDFGESVYRVYTKLKEILQESNRNMTIPYREHRNISFDTEMFVKHYVLRFLIKYHKKLWKRFDVPRKFFYSVGTGWESDVENLRKEASNFINSMDKFLDDKHIKES